MSGNDFHYQLNCNDELAHGILEDIHIPTCPAIKVFRSDILDDYYGPFVDELAIIEFLVEDSAPAVAFVNKLAEVQALHAEVRRETPLLVGFFDQRMVDEKSVEWVAFDTAAEKLRGYDSLTKL